MSRWSGWLEIGFPCLYQLTNPRVLDFGGGDPLPTVFGPDWSSWSGTGFG